MKHKVPKVKPKGKRGRPLGSKNKPKGAMKVKPKAKPGPRPKPKVKQEVKYKGEHKLCPDHGKRYLLLPDWDHPCQTGMCSHPTCILKNIHACCKSFKYLNRLLLIIKSKKCVDELISFIVIELLGDIHNRGRKATINPAWLRFRLLTFINTKMKKGIIPMADLPTRVRNDNVFLPFTEELENMMDTCVNRNTEVVQFRRGYRLSSTTEEIFFAREAFEIVKEAYGNSILLYLCGNINLVDLSKLLGTTYGETKQYLEQVKEDLKIKLKDYQRYE